MVGHWNMRKIMIMKKQKIFLERDGEAHVRVKD
jgi:hypothetical protein